MHEIQRKIIIALRYKPGARFSELGITEVDSNKLSYHLNELEKNKILENKEGKYTLTVEGKKQLNFISDETAQIRKLPVPIVVFVANQGKKFLFQERLKEPLYGYYVLPGGKIEFGETLHEALLREMQEETNIKGKATFLGLVSSRTFEGVNLAYHVHMYCYRIDEAEGVLTEKFKEGKNSWCTAEDIKKIKIHPLDYLVYTKRNETNWFIEWEGYFENDVFVRDKVTTVE